MNYESAMTGGAVPVIMCPYVCIVSRVYSAFSYCAHVRAVANLYQRTCLLFDNSLYYTYIWKEMTRCVLQIESEFVVGLYTLHELQVHS